MKHTRLFSLLSVLLTASRSACRPPHRHRETRPRPAVAAGQKQKISGVILSREIDKLVVRDINGSDVDVSMSGATKIVEKKANPFRGARTYPVSACCAGWKSRSKAVATTRALWSPRRSNSPTMISACARSLDARRPRRNACDYHRRAYGWG